MLKIRLRRVGRKHDPSFRIVITENTSPVKGKYLESIGFYNAVLKRREVDGERAKYWISKGAQPTDVVHNLLVSEGIIKAPKVSVHAKSKKQEEEGAIGEAQTAGKTAETAKPQDVNKGADAPPEEKAKEGEETSKTKPDKK